MPRKSVKKGLTQNVSSSVHYLEFCSTLSFWFDCRVKLLSLHHLNLVLKKSSAIQGPVVHVLKWPSHPQACPVPPVHSILNLPTSLPGPCKQPIYQAASLTWQHMGENYQPLLGQLGPQLSRTDGSQIFTDVGCYVSRHHKALFGKYLEIENFT